MSDLKKQSVLELVETLGVNKPGELYMKIKNHIQEHGLEEEKSPVRVHTEVPEAVCTSCE